MLGFGHLDFEHSNLFRISIFEFRTYLTMFLCSESNS